MNDILFGAIKYLKKKVDYADIRWVGCLAETLVVKNNVVENICTDFDEGFGVRVLYKNNWGFASCPKIKASSLKSTCDLAIAIAKSTSTLTTKKEVVFPKNPPLKDQYVSKYEIDPFEVSLAKKLDYLFWASSILTEHKCIKTATCGLDFYKTNKIFVNTEGSYIKQQFVESGGYLEAIAVSGNEFAKRSYPSSHKPDLAQAGYEYVKTLDFVGGAKKIRNETIMLLRAKECPSRKTTIILDGSQMALQIHESCGHPVELDRLFGQEISYAGGSFLTPDKIGKFRYGSNIVNITSDPTLCGGCGSFGYDDEGTKAQKTDIIKNGIFVGYLNSRETAHKLNMKPSAAMRASSWNRTPLIRMTNVNLAPGEATVEELIKDTKDGIYMETNKSWSIDDLRLNFQFSCEIAWQIHNGRLGQVFKNPVYSGITPVFWNNCTGIANKDNWKIWGVPNCAKGEPIQTIHVGHGASPARFRDIEVGRKTK